MFKLIGWILKASLFTVLVLVASHYIKWNGKTITDQVGSTLSSAEKNPAVKSVKKKTKAILNDARDAAGRAVQTEIPAEDKIELQALINDGNSRI